MNKLFVNIEFVDKITNESIIKPAFISMDFATIVTINKTVDGFTFISYLNNISFKVLTPFWDFIEDFKEANNLNIDIEELIKIYDKGSFEDDLLNGI